MQNSGDLFTCTFSFSYHGEKHNTTQNAEVFCSPQIFIPDIEAKRYFFKKSKRGAGLPKMLTPLQVFRVLISCRIGEVTEKKRSISNLFNTYEEITANLTFPSPSAVLFPANQQTLAC